MGGWVLIWCKFLVESFIMCWSLLLWPYHYNTHHSPYLLSATFKYRANNNCRLLLTIFLGGKRFSNQFQKCSFKYIPLHYVSCYDLHQPLKEWFKNVTYTLMFLNLKNCYRWKNFTVQFLRNVHNLVFCCGGDSQVQLEKK